MSKRKPIPRMSKRYERLVFSRRILKSEMRDDEYPILKLITSSLPDTFKFPYPGQLIPNTVGGSRFQ